MPLRCVASRPGVFCEGRTHALIADLAQIEALRVISRTSAMRFKGTHPPLSELARDLRVDAVVEGSALRVGDLADEIPIQVTPDEPARLRSKGAVNPAAAQSLLDDFSRNAVRVAFSPVRRLNRRGCSEWKSHPNVK